MAFKVSIIIPVYNVASYIGDCLESVLQQTYLSLEVILVDDASPDDSMRLAAPWIEKFRQKFVEVKIVKHPCNRGLSAARNTGIAASTANWIFFLDSDDELIPKCIELLAEQVERHPDVDFVIGGVKVTGSKMEYPLKCSSYMNSNQEIKRSYIDGKWYVMACNRLYRKQYLLENSLFFKEGLLHEDVLFSFQMAITAQSMAVVYADTYVYKIRLEGSISSHLGLKNFSDLLFINGVIFTYVLKSYQAGIYDIPYSYCLKVAFAFLYAVVENQELTKNEKKFFLSKLKSIYSPLHPFVTHQETIKYRIADMIMKLPISLMLVIIKAKFVVSRY